jgi:hypothetical protein
MGSDRWKRFTMPFTKQYFHLRDLQKSGKLPQFGSFKYSAHYLYDKGILLSIDQFSPRQFDKIDIVISSNSVGVFALEMFNNALGITNRMATTELRMEDLLQAQFDGKSTLPIFEGTAKVHLSALLVHINKKYVNGQTILLHASDKQIQVLHTIITPVLYPFSVAIFRNVSYANSSASFSSLPVVDLRPVMILIVLSAFTNTSFRVLSSGGLLDAWRKRQE